MCSVTCCFLLVRVRTCARESDPVAVSDTRRGRPLAEEQGPSSVLRDPLPATLCVRAPWSLRVVVASLHVADVSAHRVWRCPRVVRAGTSVICTWCISRVCVVALDCVPCVSCLVRMLYLSRGCSRFLSRVRVVSGLVTHGCVFAFPVCSVCGFLLPVGCVCAAVFPACV